ncbi:MAG: T9SS type A sorting domain-containing protein [Bacteroidales bacterium]|nr:T9SS type A sorting domain-containing protein [Bacteroidales bacterium]
MRRVFTFFIALMLTSVVFADQWVNINSDSPQEAQTKLISSDVNTSVVNFYLPGFTLEPVKIDGQLSYTVKVDGGTPILEAGAPDLAKLNASVIIPNQDQMQVEVVTSEYTDYNDMLIAPSKGNLYRDVDPSTVDYTYGETYSENKFYPENIASLRAPYILRDFRGQTIVVNPFQYNPVTKVLRVYHDVTVKVSSTGNVGENILTQESNDDIKTEFQNIYNYQFLNADAVADRYDAIGEHGNMLIISYGDFMDAMAPFVEWKRLKGIPVEMVDVAEVGSSASAIATYIEDYFNTNGLTYVMLIGDAAQVPTSYSNGDSDVKYTYVVGTDHYPDLIIGRFSAESVADVDTQVQRILAYEKTPDMGDTDWYTRSLGIASDQGTGDDNEMDYEHIQNIHDVLLAYTYTDEFECYDGSQGGNDNSGNPPSSEVGDNVNAGVTVINYVGHGSDNSFVTSGFNNNDVNNLTNVNKLPFIWSVACVNGNFVGQTCFAEAWLRATDATTGEPTGAISMMASTINQSWAPPMEGQDAFNDILTEIEAGVIRRTFGSISFNGMCRMNDAYGSEGDDMTDTWTLFGDPSLMVRTDVPAVTEANYTPTIFVGATDFALTATDCEGAVAALSLDGVLLGSAIINGGAATINFDAIATVGEATLVITPFNKIPLIEAIDVIVPEGPYVVYRSNQINDAAANGNQALDCGEAVLLNVDVENVGVEATSNVEFTLTTDNTFVTISDATESLATISADQLVTLSDAFAFEVTNEVPDQTAISFHLAYTDGTNDWASDFNIIANAPDFAVGNMTMVEVTGNGNGRMDPGEVVNVTIASTNIGHADATDATATLISQSPFLTIQDEEVTISNFGAGAVESTTYTVEVSAGAPIGTAAAMLFTVEAGVYTALKEFVQSIGLVLEDWETGDLTNFDWELSGDADWFTQEAITYEGQYALQSGVIDHSQSTNLNLNYEVTTPGTVSFYYKVSSESGYDFLKFYVNGSEIQKWSGDIDWTYFEMEVDESTTSFRWEYMKDNMVSSGDDCAWVDFIVLPASVSLNAYAGQNTATCDDMVQLNGSATAQDYVTWTTSGNGTFADAASPATTYTLGDDDLNSVVTLTLTAYLDGSDPVASSFELTSLDAPTAVAGADAEICVGETYELLATVENTSEMLWSTSGTGTFDDATLAGAVYTPGDEDITAGAVTLTISAIGSGDCPDATSDMNLSFGSAVDPLVWYSGAAEVNVYETTESAYSIETVVGADTFDWKVEPTEAGVAAFDGVQATITWDADFRGVATITVTADNDCGTEVISKEVNIFSTVGFGEFKGMEVNVYPNPASDMIKIALTSEENETVNIKIVSAVGNVIYKQSNVAVNHTTNVLVGEFANGVYMLIIENNKGRFVQRLVVR